MDSFCQISSFSSSLKWIFVDSFLSGYISDSLCSCTKLILLVLYGNAKLETTLPPCLDKLADLRWLELRKNNLRGPVMTLPAASLHLLDLRSNNFDGSFPVIQGAQHLDRVLIDKNRFSSMGGVLDAPKITLIQAQNNLIRNVPRLELLPALVRLELNNNLISGRIPKLYGMCHLSKLVLSSNKFAGAISADLVADHPHLQEIILHSNELTSIPRLIGKEYKRVCFGRMTKVANCNQCSIDVSGNQLSDSLRKIFVNIVDSSPTSWHDSVDVSNNPIKDANDERGFPLRIRLAPNLQHLHASKCGFTGSFFERSFAEGQSADGQSVLQTIDVTHNNFTSGLQNSLPSSVKVLKIQDSLPPGAFNLSGSILRQTGVFKLHTTEGTVIRCPQLTSHGDDVIELDPKAYSFEGCTCAVRLTPLLLVPPKPLNMAGGLGDTP